MLDDGHYVFEVEGLSEHDPDAHLFPNSKKPDRIRFSTAPITVSLTQNQVSSKLLQIVGDFVTAMRLSGKTLAVLSWGQST